ncbi:hypothetical protein D3C75_1113900 [compost metagenome]
MTLGLRLQASALQQLMQRLRLAVVAAQARAAFAGCQVVVPGEQHACLLGKTVEGADQGAGRDRVMTLLPAG